MVFGQDERGFIRIDTVTSLHVRLQALPEFERFRATSAFETSNGHVNDAVMPVQIRLVGEVPAAEHAGKFLRLDA